MLNFRGGLTLWQRASTVIFIFAAVFDFAQLVRRQRGLDVILGVRKLPTIANFLAVWVNVAVSAECFDVMAVSENAIIGDVMAVS